MKSISLGDKLRYALREPHYPGLGIEFNSDCIRLAVVRSDRGAPLIQHVDSEPLPAGAVEITPFKPNIVSMEAVAGALKSLWARSPVKSPRACLLIQDRSALVFNVAMEHAAKNWAECQDLLRFKLKKSVPFHMEDAGLASFTPGGSFEPSAVNQWVVVVAGAVLRQYEQFVESTLNVEIGLVDLSMLGLMNLAASAVRAQNMSGRDLLYVNLNRDYLSLAIVQNSRLTSFRTRPMEAGISPVEAAITEIHPTVMYYHDKLDGQDLACAFVHAPGMPEELNEQIQTQAGVTPVPFPLERYAGSRFDPSQPAFLAGFTPLAGLLLSRMVEYR